MGTKRTRLAVGALLGLGTALAAASVTYAPELARQIPWLEVQRVEVVGATLLSPAELIAAAEIRTGQHLFEEGVDWERALRSHPMVASATIARIPPGTVRLIVTEKSPVALVQEDALGLATTTGEILPLDPTLHALDLPIVRGTRADSASAAVLQRLLTETQRLVTLDPLLMAEISEIDTFSADPDALVLLHPDAKIVLPFGADRQRLAELRAVLAAVVPGGSSGAPSLDLRFRDQIVVRHNSPLELS